MFRVSYILRIYAWVFVYAAGSYVNPASRLSALSAINNTLQVCAGGTGKSKADWLELGRVKCARQCY